MLEEVAISFDSVITTEDSLVEMKGRAGMLWAVALVYQDSTLDLGCIFGWDFTTRTAPSSPRQLGPVPNKASVELRFYSSGKLSLHSLQASVTLLSQSYHN